jgi:hypothetical protein
VFQGVPYASMTTGSSFTLGKFGVAATPDGDGSATYTNVPFHIAFRVQSLDGAAPSPNDTPVTLSGRLNAVLTDGQITSLTAQFTHAQVPGGPPPYPTTVNPFQIGDYKGYLNITSTGDGGTPIQGTLNLAQVPEPTSILVFAAAGGLFALRSRSRSRSRS